MTIPISEQFLSFQGEGPTTGTRAVFLRTHACNLLCGGGKYAAAARWVCDTIPVFTKIQKQYSPEELLKEWREKDWLSALADGAHLVITGGEPLMPERQEELIPFLEILRAAMDDIFIEVETNGTFTPLPEFNRYISHYTVSPKLASSGMPRKMCIQPEVLRWHVQCPTSVFKFVIHDAADSDELVADFIRPFNIPTQRIWLMPAASSRAQLLEKSTAIAALAQQLGCNFSTRLHILLYDQTCGV